jgi:hypothetical protein
VAFSWAILYWEPLQNVLGTGPVPLAIYALAWLCIPIVFVIDYLQKLTLNRFMKTAKKPETNKCQA